ncbi:UDP-galactose transporter [Rhodotorula toruloides]|uniref:UDP-galactose transporter homolog 1 n=2 Tax=Rhodotorula toruloides TaxID=5286 RepID=A0A061ANK8_RHOTO|nr:UDP-Glc/Gal endoplasmic reticulum nucleotide sugar transporter [Rhodotorula toruloides NP11]EMS19076.1 UDP-Glc/Gal endoplasmic reticulum nucleotide sugar transporter [Rhodotorula toruloides NP11]KAJ8296459.1 UDP-galactose transporter 1 [Rhodotorula toruloides]CDR36919.1 RHTO0S02e08548g1_1 [Rhodotorula toruloides]
MAAQDTRVNPLVQLGICVGGIYVSFLVWALCQERLSTTPYLSTGTFPTSDKFRSVLFMNTVQSIFSVFSAFLYLVITKKRHGVAWREVLGLPSARSQPTLPKEKATSNGVNGMNGTATQKSTDVGRLLRLYAFIALVASSAAPFGFLALSHISFPTLLLGKSCKLVPVMLMNILLYRRKFPFHKYALVALVTAGIWAFMAFKPSKPGKVGGRETSSVLGLVLLAINLIFDGVVNATQDHVFSTFTLDGEQMMFFMNAFATLFTFAALIFPFSLTPSFLLPASAGSGAHFNELSSALAFIRTHPSVKVDILLFGLTGSIGQLFIFATLSLYGSLTLVTITVTRKMATMLLSVFVFEHRLTKGQWAGVGMVFGAVAMEAIIARREKKHKKAGRKEA